MDLDLSRVDAGNRYSRSVTFNGVIYLTGVTARDRSQDILGQTLQALRQLDEHLENAGSDKTHLLRVLVLLREVDRDFAGMNEVWDSWATPGLAPARATFEARLGAPEILIELVATAAARTDTK